MGAEDKLGIFKFNNKLLYCITRLIFIKRKQKQKMMNTKQ